MLKMGTSIATLARPRCMSGASLTTEANYEIVNFGLPSRYKNCKGPPKMQTKDAKPNFDRSLGLAISGHKLGEPASHDRGTGPTR